MAAVVDTTAARAKLEALVSRPSSYTDSLDQIIACPDATKASSAISDAIRAERGHRHADPIAPGAGWILPP